MTESTKKRVLVDCDGVLADFSSAALDLIEARTGDRHSKEELIHWDVFKSVDKKNLEHVLRDAVEREGFCLSLPPLPGAKQLIQTLERYYDVYIVTSPFLAREWVYERTRWLEAHLAIPADRIVHTKSKFLVKGDVLIDDSGRNLRSWKTEWPEGQAIIYDAPYNQGDTEFPRARNWRDVIRILRDDPEITVESDGGIVPFTVDGGVTQEYAAWLVRHYPDQLVALDPEGTVLAASKIGGDFEIQLRQLKRDGYNVELTLHTSNLR